MNILAWLNPARWLILIAAVGALTLGYALWVDHQQDIGEARANARWKAATDKLKAEAIATLASETAKTRAAEQALQAHTHQQEVSDANHQKTVAALAERLRAAAGPTWRLRDPNAPGCWGSSRSAPGSTAPAPADRPDDGTQADGLLSAELTGLLHRLQREADDINIAYASCREDAFAVRAGR